ncbi:aldehyde dehydrogenase [Pseudaquabacterium pictum]|uniref:Gamma-glutamyl-gamma-aminobutyraldehyde dehydrogenase n=1 Tax=Pseudaquabacterium pictum TaxID=2315236 RepID=A0A480APQ8_9BURK|nr:aldehyde dehydrogenase [Rubrivivax pictus]GCL61655.1 gamma-glutamyl-gamma-aminobutyraldehyde dehydrogenase [Rubrivivax pictus]
MSDTTPQAAPTRADWHARAAALQLDGRLWIDGRRCDAADGRSFTKRSPGADHPLPPIARGAEADIDRAVRSARAAFDDGRWRLQSPARRKAVLVEWSRRVLAAAEELALIETIDMGKPIARSLAADVPGTARTLAWYGEAVDKIYDEVAPTAADALALITREPLGVVGAIVPWNYPLLMSAWKLGPALAAGNSVVLKPSERSPFSAMRLAELALEAGLPPGVLNVVPGYGHEAGEALALHMDVDGIGFTGSTRIGKRMFGYAGQSNLKRMFTELGGKSAVLVFPGSDVEGAAAAVAGTLFYNQGESCNAPSRVLVHRSLADQFVQALVAQTAHYQPGDPLDPQAGMGALVDAAHADSVLAFIDGARAAGARCAVGGQRVADAPSACYVAPTVFDQVEPGMGIATEEVFGPVASVLRFDTEAQALALANDSPYGLQAGVWSRDLSQAHRVARGLRAGTVHVNQYNDDDITVPFGGMKQSGNGRDKSLHAFDKYTELKTTWLRIDPA